MENGSLHHRAFFLEHLKYSKLSQLRIQVPRTLKVAGGTGGTEKLFLPIYIITEQP